MSFLIIVDAINGTTRKEKLIWKINETLEAHYFPYNRLPRKFHRVYVTTDYGGFLSGSSRCVSREEFLKLNKSHRCKINRVLGDKRSSDDATSTRSVAQSGSTIMLHGPSSSPRRWEAGTVELRSRMSMNKCKLCAAWTKWGILIISRVLSFIAHVSADWINGTFDVWCLTSEYDV